MTTNGQHWSLHVIANGCWWSLQLEDAWTITTQRDRRGLLGSTFGPQRTERTGAGSCSPVRIGALEQCWDDCWPRKPTDLCLLYIFYTYSYSIHILYISHHISTFSHKWLTLNCQLLWCSWKQLLHRTQRFWACWQPRQGASKPICSGSLSY